MKGKHMQWLRLYHVYGKCERWDIRSKTATSRVREALSACKRVPENHAASAAVVPSAQRHWLIGTLDRVFSARPTLISSTLPRLLSRLAVAAERAGQALGTLQARPPVDGGDWDGGCGECVQCGRRS